MSLIDELNDFQLKVLIAAGCIKNMYDTAPVIELIFTKDWDVNQARLVLHLVTDAVMQSTCGKMWVANDRFGSVLLLRCDPETRFNLVPDPLKKGK